MNNARGLPTSMTEASGTPLARATTTTWHGTYQKPTQIVALNLTTDFTYDANGNLLTRTETDTTAQVVPYSTNGQTRTWTYSYTTAGLLETVDGPLAGSGDTTTYAYDASGYLTSITDALGHVTDITAVNGRGQPTSIAGPNGIVTTFAYDPRGLLARRVVDPGPNESVTRFEYDGVGQVVRMLLPDGTTLRFGYDAARRLTEIANESGERVVYTLDGLGNIVKEDTQDSADVIRKTMSRTFDELGRLLTQIGAGTQTTTFAYNKNDLVTSITDPRSNATGYAFDALSRLVTVTNAVNDTADYAFNPSDDLTSVTDQRSLATTYVHNGFGDVIRRDSPDSGITDYEYNAAGNVTRMTDARGVVTEYSYDDLYRRTTKTFPASPSENVTYSYDDVTSGNRGRGRLTKIEDASGSLSLVYDARGNVVRETRVIGTQSYVTDYGYDAADKLVRVTYPSGRIVDYGYDREGRVEQVATAKTAASASVIVVSNIRYLPFGPIESLIFGNGIQTTFSYDTDYRLTAIDAADGTTPVQDLDYVYGDANGDADNIRSITDHLDLTLNEAFNYDALYRLTDADGAYGNIDYAYDAAGNRSSRTIAAGTITTETLAYATTSNRLLTVGDGAVTRTLTYDATGNVTTDSRATGFVYVYNHDNRLVSVTEGGVIVASYAYNDRGERLVKDLGSGNVTHYHFDQDGILIAESNAAGVVEREYIHLNGLPLAVIDAGGSGTPASLTLDNDSPNASATGTWTLETNGSGYEGANYAERAGGDGSGSFIWAPTIPAAKQYQVFAKWPSETPRPSSASYKVHHAGGSTNVAVDQRRDGGDWNLLGSFVMNPGQNHRVTLSDAVDPVGVHDVVIDNTHPGTIETGSWVERSGIGRGYFWGTSISRMDTADAAAAFVWPASEVPERGLYRVYARWTASYRFTLDYALSADYEIFHTDGTTVVSVNQQESGGQWMPLGIFELAPQDGPLVRLSGFDNNGWLSADAIRIVRLRKEAVDLIVDAEDPNVTFTGAWNEGTWLGGGFPVGSVFHWTDAGTGTKKISWPLAVPVAGKYRIYGKWMSGGAGGNRATDVKYTVFHDGGQTEVVADHELNAGIWTLLGLFDLTPGQSPRIEVNDDANGLVAPDAVRAVLHTTNETEFVVDTTDGTVAGTWGNGTARDQGIPYGVKVLFSDAGLGANSVTWPLNVPSAGEYRLYTRWSSAANRNSAAPYEVHHAGGTVTVEMDQRRQVGVWVPLGLFDLAPGSDHKVILRDLGSNFTIADAIKVVPVELGARAAAADAIRLVANDAEELLYVHTDHLGAPQKMTDGTRTVVWDAAFRPFGEQHALGGSEGNNQRTPGQYFDGETGFHYNYRRDYDPSTGRYLESDPIGLAGGLNTYLYALANPVRFTDPTGQFVPLLAIPALAGAGGGTAVAGGITLGGVGKALFGGAALAALLSIPGDSATDKSDIICQEGCPPCKTISGRIVDVGTIGYRPLDVIPDNEKQHGVYGSHHNLFRANQIPAPNCDCFWQKLKDVAKPHEIQPDWIPIEPFAN